ncbi:MVK family protein [Megaselia abdita]
MVHYKVSAPGKIILHGEHSVVYGKDALVSAIGLRTNLEIKETDSEVIFIDFPSLKFQLEIPLIKVNEFLVNSDGTIENVKDFVENQFKRSNETENNTLVALFYVLKKAFGNEKVSKAFDLSVKTDLRIGGGSGSSAAFGVSIATGFLLLTGKMKENTLDHEMISNLAFESERVIHLNPSGVDNTICTYGGLLKFAKGKGFSKLTIPKQLNILIVDTGVSRSTAKLVSQVRDLHEGFPILFDNIFESMNILVQEAIKKYSEFNGDITDIEKLFEINSGLLTTIGVSHPSLEEIYKISRKNNFSSKLTGAGGGGYAIVILPSDYKNKENFENLISELNEAGFETTETVIGGGGVSVERV